MKKSVVWIVAVLLFAALIVGASVLYGKLSDEYKNDDTAENTSAVPGETTAAANAAPDFTVQDLDGNEVKLSDFKGTPVVINFWATWCYYCKEEMPDFNEAYKNHPEVKFLMINATDGVQETVETAKAYVEKEGFDFDIFFDTNSDAVKAYNISGFPSTFFIDADGNLTAQRIGMLDAQTLEKGIGMIAGNR